MFCWRVKNWFVKISFVTLFTRKISWCTSLVCRVKVVERQRCHHSDSSLQRTTEILRDCTNEVDKSGYNVYSRSFQTLTFWFTRLPKTQRLTFDMWDRFSCNENWIPKIFLGFDYQLKLEVSVNEETHKNNTSNQSYFCKFSTTILRCHHHIGFVSRLSETVTWVPKD